MRLSFEFFPPRTPEGRARLLDVADRLTRFRPTFFSVTYGADVPRWIYKHLEAYRDDESALREFGVEAVTRLCQDLLAGEVPGLHFYTLNRSDAATRICENLSLAVSIP